MVKAPDSPTDSEVSEPSSRMTKTFKCGHENEINQLSVNADYEHFLSSDDRIINMWNFDKEGIIYTLIKVAHTLE